MKYIIILVCFLSISIEISGQESFQQVVTDCENKYLNEPNMGYRQKSTLNCLLGSKLPDFTGTTVEGEMINSKDLSGSITVINLWFRNCAPCLAEMPGLNKLYNEYHKKGVNFISFTTDTEEVAKKILENELEFHFDVIPNAKEIIYHDLNLTFGFPTTIIVDGEGIIKYISVGGSTHENTPEIVFNTLSTQLQMCL